MPEHTVTLREQIACAKRELAMRERVYPKLVLRGDMTEAAKAKELAAMQAIIDTLESLRDEVPPF